MTTSCSTGIKSDGKPIASLCILDFEAKVCWKNQATGKSIKFEDMKDSCELGDQCWFAIDGIDLKRIKHGLNK